MDPDDLTPGQVSARRALGSAVLGLMFTILAPFAFITVREPDSRVDYWLGITFSAVAVFFHTLALSFIFDTEQEAAD